MTKRIFYFALAVALTIYAGAASAQQLSLSQVSQYLNQLQSAQGGFTQIHSDGTLSTGQIYIKRPGRIRFEYNPPDEALVMAGGGQLAVFDPRSNTVLFGYTVASMQITDKFIYKNHIKFNPDSYDGNNIILGNG